MLGRWWRAPRERVWEIAAAAVAMLLVAFACVQALRWARSQPLALGVMDAPAGREVPAAGGLAVRGWALDPFGVESVEIVLGPLRKTVQPDISSGDLHAVHPGYPGSARGRFALDLTPEDLRQAGAPNPLALRAIVHGRGGSTTEVDARRLVFRP
jgi:hypothetical protein